MVREDIHVLFPILQEKLPVRMIISCGFCIDAIYQIEEASLYS